MSDILPAVLGDIPLGLDKSFFDKYETLDEKQDLYADIKKAAAASSWMQADFFKYLWEESDEKTLNKFAASVGESPGTINNYIRTAVAFEKDRRDAMATFSHHFQASLADSYDSKTRTFDTDHRFTWLDKAVDERLTTRALNEQIMRDKKVKEIGAPAACNWCHKSSGDVVPYNLYNCRTKHTDHMDFHEICYQSLLAYASQER